MFVGILAFVLAVVWLIFPFIVMSKADKMLAQLTEIARQLQLLNQKGEKGRRSDVEPPGV